MNRTANRSRRPKTDWAGAAILATVGFVAGDMYAKGVIASMRGGKDFVAALADFDTITSTWWPPSLDPRALMTGGTVALLIILMTAISALNTRTTRTGAEEGSSKWADHKEMEPYQATDPQWNLLMTKTEGLCTQTNMTFRNLNALIIGSSGSGKTRGYVKPNLMLPRPDNTMSWVVTDPDGGTRAECEDTLRARGYRVQALDLNDMPHSAHFEPMDYIDPNQPETSILQLVDCFMSNTSGSADAQAKEDFWAKSERALLTALLSYEYFSADHPRFIAVSDFILQMQAAERGEKQEKSPMDRDMESMRTLVDTVRNNADSADAETLKAIDGLDFALRQYSTYLKGAGETKKSIIISVAVRTAPLQINTVQALLTDIDANKEKEYGQEDTKWIEQHHNLHLDTVGDRPTVLFLNLPDTDTSFNFIAAIFYQMLFTALSVHADHLPKKHLDYPVHMLLDEFANIGRIPNFERLIAVIRKRWISVSVIIQNLAQLKTAYKDSWETIAGNCDSKLFLGGNEESTEKFVSAQLGKETISVRGDSESTGRSGSHSTSWSAKGRALLDEAEVGKIPNTKCIYMLRGLDPFYSDKIVPDGSLYGCKIIPSKKGIKL